MTGAGTGGGAGCAGGRLEFGYEMLEKFASVACWGGAASLSCHCHLLLRSLTIKSTFHPVSLCIFEKISSTSSCSRRITRHSAAIANDRNATLATPLSLTCAVMPQIW